MAGLFDLLLERLRRLDGALLALPLRPQAAAFLLQVREVLVEPRQALLRGGVGLLAQRLALDLELHDPAFRLVELDRQRVDLRPQLGRRLVDQVDGLVRQEAVADVALRQHRRGHERGILERHAVMYFVPLAQAAQDADGVLDAGFVDHDRLKAALERGVLLDVLAVFIEGRGADGVELAAREHRLQHVRGVDGALGSARADDRVQLVDEQDDPAGGGRDFLQHRLEAFLELAPVFGARHQRADVEGDDAFLLESLGNVLAHDALREPFHDGRLADAGLADQHGIVLGAPRQHLHDAPDFVVAADDRIEVALAGARRQIGAIALERFVLALRIGIRHALRAAHRLQHFLNPVRRGLVGRQDLRRGCAAAFGGQRQQQVLGADVLVLQPLGLGRRAVHRVPGPRRQRRRRAAARGRQPGELGAGGVRDRGGIDAQAPQHRRHHPVLLRRERSQEVLRLQLRVPGLFRRLLCGEQRLLRLLRQPIQVHVSFPRAAPGDFSASAASAS